MRTMHLILTQDMSKIIPIKAELTSRPRPKVLQDACKKALLFFVLALVSILVPVFHFVLVPLFLILTWIAFFKSFSWKYQLSFERPALCIQCQKPLKTQIILKDDSRVLCEECHSWYLLQSDPEKGLSDSLNPSTEMT